MLHRTLTLSMLALVPLGTPSLRRASPADYVQVVRRVDVTVGGQPFTSYIYPTSLMKPVLYPLRTAAGTVVTRGYPLEPRQGERVDHPHHAGLWFEYGNVSGIDFWNNSTAIKKADAPKMGTILHRAVKNSTSGAGEGTLDVVNEWVNSQGRVLLKEDTKFIFRAHEGFRSVDRITTLTAVDSTVTFTDDKEGLIGMRVARSLEQPSNTPEKFVDATGRATTVAVLDNTGVTGQYTSSEGKVGDAVWGTRGRWTMLTGTVGTEPVTLAILDHPKNVGYPTYWHARGYGLFAANNLGQKVMSGGKEELNFSLPAGKSVTFRHQVLVLHGTATPADLENYWAGFSK